MKNILGYLGFLGLLGVLGFITDSKAYFGFFGFLGYFRYFAVIPDELFKANVKNAATPAFFAGIVVFAITVALTAFIKYNDFCFGISNWICHLNSCFFYYYTG